MMSIGAAGGMFGSLMGLAGGVVMVPLMVSFTSIPQKVATGTSLMAALFVGGVGAVGYGYHGLVDVFHAESSRAGLH
jgi:uncharacterized membrane protein YfcA